MTDNPTTDIIGRTLWNAHVRRQGNPESWMSWEEAKTEDSLIAMECLEDAEAIVLALGILNA